MRILAGVVIAYIALSAVGLVRFSVYAIAAAVVVLAILAFTGSRK